MSDDFPPEIILMPPPSAEVVDADLAATEDLDRMLAESERAIRAVPREPLRLPPGFPIERAPTGPRERAQRAAELRQRELDRQARSKLNGRLPDVPFKVAVVGVSFRDPSFVEQVGLTWLHLTKGQELPDAIGAQLVRQPDNPADPNAVAVWLQLDVAADMVGFLPRGVAARLAPELDAGEQWVARLVTYGEGSQPLIPVIEVEIQRLPDEPWQGLEDV